MNHLQKHNSSIRNEAGESFICHSHCDWPLQVGYLFMEVTLNYCHAQQRFMRVTISKYRSRSKWCSCTFVRRWPLQCAIDYLSELHQTTTIHHHHLLSSRRVSRVYGQQQQLTPGYNNNISQLRASTDTGLKTREDKKRPRAILAKKSSAARDHRAVGYG